MIGIAHDALFCAEFRVSRQITDTEVTRSTAVSQSVDLGQNNNPNTTPTKDYKMCEWWFTSAVSREDVLRRGRGDLHQQGDADRDAGYSWGTGAVEDKGDRCLDSSYSLGSVKAGIEVTETEVAVLHLEISAARGQGGS